MQMRYADFIEQTLSEEDSNSTSRLQTRLVYIYREEHISFRHLLLMNICAVIGGRITSQAYEKEEKIRISKISLWLQWKSRNGEVKEQIDQQVRDNVGICN